MLSRTSVPLTSNFLVPDASFLVALVVALLLGGLLVGGLVRLLARRP